MLLSLVIAPRIISAAASSLEAMWVLACLRKVSTVLEVSKKVKYYTSE